jgi:hypothetical protein
MTDLNAARLETLGPENIVELAGSPAPCISIFLPAHRPGGATQSMAAVLKMHCQEADRQLRARELSVEEVTELLEPLQRSIDDPELAKGSHWGRAIFRSPELFVQMNGLESTLSGITVGGCFQLRPILAELHFPPKFYLLTLSEKHVDLLLCSDRKAQTVELPAGVPRSLEEALAFKPPDHDLENRSTAGSSTGSMRSVRFGTTSEREKSRVYLADFFKAVDRGIREIGQAGTVPLVLAGVEEETALYRYVSTYPSLAKEGIAGSPKTPFSTADLLSRAYAILRSDLTSRTSASLKDWRERVAPERFSTDLDAILRAATEGRVGWLFINEAGRTFGTFEGTRRNGRVNWGSEDLLNVAAVETLLQRGLVYSLPSEAMPDGIAIAAVLRY